MRVVVCGYDELLTESILLGFMVWYLICVGLVGFVW